LFNDSLTVSVSLYDNRQIVDSSVQWSLSYKKNNVRDTSGFDTNEDGIFTIFFNGDLPEDTIVLQVNASDSYGNKGGDSIIIAVDRTSPVYNFFSHTSITADSSAADSLVVIINANDSCGIKTGYPRISWKIGSGAYSDSTTMKSLGNNNYSADTAINWYSYFDDTIYWRVWFVDNLNNETSSQHFAVGSYEYIDKSGLRIDIKYPSSLKCDTFNNIITISGTTFTSQAGDSVLIYVNSALNYIYKFQF